MKKQLTRSIIGALLVLLLGSWAQAMSVIPPTFAELVAEADGIVKVRVTGVTSQWDARGGR